MPKGQRTRKHDVPGSEEYESEETEDSKEEVFIDIDRDIYKVKIDKKRKRRNERLFPRNERAVRRQMFLQNTKATLLLVGYIVVIALTIHQTTYSEQREQEIPDLAPFGFGTYPYDTPFELRDVSRYSKVVAIGDLHGDLEQTVSVLKLTGILDENGDSKSMDTILVRTGDIADRGRDSLEIYKLFFKLKEAAKASNGLVLQILGNHELMNLRGQYRYVHREEMEKYGARKKWEELWSVDHEIGYFLRSSPILRIIGNTLFVHAGLSPEILSLIDARNKTDYLNEAVIKGNKAGHSEDALYLKVVGNDGPLWTRDFSTILSGKWRSKGWDKEEVITEYICQQTQKTLDIMKVKRMVIGHNVQRNGKVKEECDGKLYSIDVGMSCVYGCNLGAIVIDLQSDTVTIV